MRKLVASTFVSLDGVMEAPDKWQLANDLFDDDMGKLIDETYRAADAMLMGRVTYQEFASFWPTQSDDDPFAKTMNGMPKFVVSKTLKTLEWQNSTQIKGDVAAEVSRLKQQPGKNIAIVGSAQLVNGLTKDGLIDEYQLWVHPVVVGRGKHLFKDGIDPTLLKLVDTKTFGTGVVVLTYERKGKAVLGAS
jgi:dihydrofolate reductase